MAARTRARASSSSQRGLRDAINDVVNALPTAALRERLSAVEEAVSRLEREVRRVFGGDGRRSTTAGGRRAPGKRATAKRGGGAKRGTAKRGGAAKRGTAKRGGAAKRGTAKRTTAKRGTAKRATRTTSARTKRTTPKRTTAATRVRRRTATAPAPETATMSRGDAAQLEELTPQLTAPEPAPPPSQSDAEADLASQNLSTTSSPEWPGALPSF
jgi:hypothetical protein